MFDFGFSELVVVGVVALVVLGPTRLPGLVRKVGRWVGKARSMAREFRDQLENEVNIEELNRAVKRQVMDEPPPWQPPGADVGASSPADAAASTPADAPDPFANSGYPYGVVSDTSATTADPSVVPPEPQPGDDTFSHAHAPGATPEPWNPEPAAPSEESQGAAVTADAASNNTDPDGNRRHDA
jgi:sec-independent protein translocase protein TatB